MKKEMFITVTLLLGVSFKSYAGTGNTNDGLKFFLVIIGLLLIVLGLFSGVDYLQKNGKTMINNAMSFLNRKINLLRNYLKKVKSDYFNLSYF